MYICYWYFLMLSKTIKQYLVTNWNSVLNNLAIFVYIFVLYINKFTLEASSTLRGVKRSFSVLHSSDIHSAALLGLKYHPYFNKDALYQTRL